MTTLPFPAPAAPAPTWRLPNARAGHAYRHTPDLAEGRTVAIEGVELPAGLALAFDAASGALTGTPAQAGEYTLAITWRPAGEPSGHPRLAHAQLVVTPDPKTLWRDQPSDRSDPYWRPDQSAQQLGGAGLRVLAASKRGRSHAHVGGFRDDDYAIDALPATGWSIAIAADGAGSARHSRKGAAVICEQARDTLRTLLAGERSTAIDQAAAAWHQARAVPGEDGLRDAAWQTLRNALYGVVGNAAYYAAKGIMDEAERRRQHRNAGNSGDNSESKNESEIESKSERHYQSTSDSTGERDNERHNENPNQNPNERQDEDLGDSHREGEPEATSARDYASTALIAICKRYPFGTLCAAYWVGDGAVGVYSARDGITLLGDVDSGEYAGQTRFLDSAAVTQEALLRRTRFDLVDDMTALVVMTDGVSDAKFETAASLARADDWHALWQELQQAVGLDQEAADTPQKLLDWLDFWSQGNHDDRTIALIY